MGPVDFFKNLNLFGVPAVVTTVAALATSLGSSLIGFAQAGTGAVARSTQDKLRESVSYKDFGAVGDGVADDYLALQAALDECKVSGKLLRHTPGIYMTSQTLNATVSSTQSLTIIGDGFGKSIIRKTAANTGAVIRVGAAAATSFTTNVRFCDFAIEGAGTGATLVGLELYDVVQSTFKVRARLCGAGMKSYGGIGLDFSGSDFNANLKGAHILKFTSLAGGGWPNIFNFYNAFIKNNTQHGIYFDNGRGLNIDTCDIENNGTNGDATTGGIWIGANVGEESGLVSPGLSMIRTWVEANSGRAAVIFESGRNKISDSYLAANANATNDVYASGGRYVLQDCDFDTNKAANIEETAGVSSNNYIINCDYNAATIDATKTVVMGATGLLNAAITATTLTASGQASLGGAAGAEAFRAKTQAGAVARVFSKGATTGGPPQLGFEGEANTGGYFVTQGTGSYQFTTRGGAAVQVDIRDAASSDRNLILSGGTVDAFISSTLGGVAFGVVLKPRSGTAAAGTSPIKFTAGTNLTTAEAGAVEYNGTNLFFTRAGTTREGVLTQSAVTTEALVSDTTVTVNIGGTTYKLLARA